MSGLYFMSRQLFEASKKIKWNNESNLYFFFINLTSQGKIKTLEKLRPNPVQTFVFKVCSLAADTKKGC